MELRAGVNDGGSAATTVELPTVVFQGVSRRALLQVFLLPLYVPGLDSFPCGLANLVNFIYK